MESNESLNTEAEDRETNLCFVLNYIFDDDKSYSICKLFVNVHQVNKICQSLIDVTEFKHTISHVNHMKSLFQKRLMRIQYDSTVYIFEEKEFDFDKSQLLENIMMPILVTRRVFEPDACRHITCETLKTKSLACISMTKEETNILRSVDTDHTQTLDDVLSFTEKEKLNNVFMSNNLFMFSHAATSLMIPVFSKNNKWLLPMGHVRKLDNTLRQY